MRPEPPSSFQGPQKSPQKSERVHIPKVTGSVTTNSSSRLQNWSGLLACTALLVKRLLVRAENLSCMHTVEPDVFLGSIVFRCAPAVVPFCLSLLTFCFCPVPFAACLLAFAVAFCLWLNCLSLPSKRLCLPGCGRYYKAAKLAEALQREHHYTVDEKQKSVLLTEQGYEDAEDVLEVWVIPRAHPCLRVCAYAYPISCWICTKESNITTEVQLLA